MQENCVRHAASPFPLNKYCVTYINQVLNLLKALPGGCCSTPSLGCLYCSSQHPQLLLQVAPHALNNAVLRAVGLQGADGLLDLPEGR
jgi:hypothetical protein